MNPHSIANAAANKWYRSTLLRHPQAFPTDPAAIAWQAGGATATGRVIRQCPHCAVSLRLPSGRSGSVQCPRCARDFQVGT
jgi:hypothetical protein